MVLAPDGKGEVGFLQWRVIEYISHTPGQALCPGGIDQHKTDSMFCCCLVGVFCETFVLLIFFLFSYLRERNKVRRVGKCGESGRGRWGGERL